jgi:hypothetical protein
MGGTVGARDARPDIVEHAKNSKGRKGARIGTNSTRPSAHDRMRGCSTGYRRSLRSAAGTVNRRSMSIDIA